MSAKRSEHTKMLKRFDAQTRAWTGQIEQQKRIIDRLLAANVAYADGLHEVQHEAKDVRQARSMARSATEKAQAILAVESHEGATDNKENNR